MRSDFELDANVTYLNSGTQSVNPRAVTEALDRYQREYNANPTMGLLKAWPRVWESQLALARFLGARAEDLFLCENVTMALNQFTLGMPLPPGSEILYTDREYGAIVNQCRFRAERDGLGLRQFELPGARATTDDEVVEALRRALGPRTSLVVVSHVISATGHRLPIEQMARVTRERGVLLAVDGAHGPGAFAIDFGKYDDIDFYGGNLHKWIMGPKGTGFGWVNPRHQAKLVPLGAGWPTYEKPEYFGPFGGGSRFAERFAPLGCRDFAALYAIRDAFEYWAKVTPAAIYRRLGALQDCVDREMNARVGWPRLTPDSRGPQLAYETPKGLAGQGHPLMRRLYDEHGLVVALSPLKGGFVLRLSPHVYNTEDEIRRAADVIARLA